MLCGCSVSRRRCCLALYSSESGLLAQHPCAAASRTMNAILKLGERLKNLKARISAARQAGDNETANRLVDVHNQHVRKQEAMIAESVCRLQFEIVGGGGFCVTMPRDDYAMYAINSITRMLPSIEANMARRAAEAPEAVDEVEARMKFFKKLREMLAARHARPLVVTATADGGAAVPVADVEGPLIMAWGSQERPMKPSEVTVRFAPKALIEILAAPRCLLVMTDPGGWRLFPLDERALATPLVEFAWQMMSGAALDDDDRADALGALRRTVAPYVAVDDKADASEPGR